jgi:hypothetical protein
MALTWRILIAVAIVIVGFVVWYSQARNAALLAERLGIVKPLGTKTLTEISWNGTYAVTDDRMLGISDSHDKDQMQYSVNAQHQLVATANGKSIVLASEGGTLMQTGDPEPQPAFHVFPGDRLTITREQGLVIWPNWFETNFMTGATPQWKKFITYRLHWQKRSGGAMDLFWRFENYYYPQDGWLTADMTGPTHCGLVEVRVTPDPK